MWRYRESDRGAGQIFFMSCDLPYYAAIDWQVAVIDRSIAIDVLSTPDLSVTVYCNFSQLLQKR